MKKIQILFILTVLILSSCQKEIKNEFVNPNTVNPPVGNETSGMFSAIMYSWKLYVQDYGEYWWQNSGNGVPAYAQIAHRYITQRYGWYSDYADLESGNGFDQSGISQFNDFYLKMKEWALLRDKIAILPPEELKENQIYFLLATVMKDVWALRNVDKYNKIPYFDAFKGKQGVFFPKYDDPKAIYISVLNDWKDIAGKLTAVKAGMSLTAQNLFANQDVAFKGDVTKWIQYCNALRLQYGVKLAGVDPTDAKPHIADALLNLPTADMIIKEFTNGETPNGGGTIVRGFYERTYPNFIPNVIMKRMNYGTYAYEPGIDDPRLPVLAMPTKFNDYRGVSMNADGATAPYNAGEKYYAYADNVASSLSKNSKSMYNFATFCWNWQSYPAMMITLAEIDLFEAEVALKGYATTPKTAGAYIKDAVSHSSDFWYGLNAMNAGWDAQYTSLHPVKVSADIATYSNFVQTNFNAAANIEDKMEILMQQKYIHLSISNEWELFAELRRTRHPLLEPMIFLGVTMKPCPERIEYPTSELQTNTDNYLIVKPEDKVHNQIFWVTPDKKTNVYYMASPLPM